MRTTKTAGAAALAVAAIATGAGAVSATTPPDAPATTTQLNAEATIDINPQPREALRQGGELRRSVASLADNWNPNHPNGGELDYSQVLMPIQYNLWLSNEAAEFTLNPNYAVSVDIHEGTPVEAAADEAEAPAGTEPAGTEAPAASGPPCALPEDPYTLTYNLNPDAKWNSGTPITAADYEANWLALNGVNTDFQVIATEGYDLVGSVEQGTDEFQVIVKFCEAYPDYEALFTNLVPAVSYADPETFNEGWLVSNTGGINNDWFAGPFKVGSYDANQGIVEMVPNENWWGEAPLLDKIIYRVISPEAVPQAFANNEIDEFDIGIDPNGFALASSTPNAVIRAAAGPNWRHFTMNSQAGNIQDQAVRQAIQMGLDRSAIGVSDLAGIPWPAQPLNNHIFVENSAYYVDNAGEFGTYDPEGAAAVLDAAGWVLGDDGIRAKDGNPLTVRFSQIVGVPASENEAQLFQAQLGALGFDVQIVDLTPDTWSDSLVAGEFEVIAFSWIGTPFPFRGVSQLYGNGSDSNYGFSQIDGLDELLTQLATSTDDTERAAIANEIDDVLWEFGHTIPLYQRPELVAVQDGLANFGAFGFMTPIDWANVGWVA